MFDYLNSNPVIDSDFLNAWFDTDFPGENSSEQDFADSLALWLGQPL